MHKKELRKRLAAGGEAILSLVREASEREVRWKAGEDRWTLLEIVNHLADEDRVDFRQRLALVWEDPELDWPPFNAFAGVEDGEYAKVDWGESVERYEAERRASLDWLDEIGDIGADRLYRGRGSEKVPMTAGDLMTAWVAHDYFHLRQIIRLRWDFLASDEHPFSPGYAGEE
jgi:hypothetical protein